MQDAHLTARLFVAGTDLTAQPFFHRRRFRPHIRELTVHFHTKRLEVLAQGHQIPTDCYELPLDGASA